MSTAMVTPAAVAASAGVRPAARVEQAEVTPLRITARGIQIALGMLWILDGVLQLQPSMFGQTFVGTTLKPTASGQPTILAWPIEHMANLVSVSPTAYNGLFAAVQVLVGIGILQKTTVKPALALSVAWAAGVWAFGEGFGMLMTPSASPLSGAPGAVLLYGMLAVLVWPRRSATVDGDESAAADGLLGERGARRLWALVWSGMGVLWLLPQNRGASSISSQIASAPTGATAAVGAPAGRRVPRAWWPRHRDRRMSRHRLLCRRLGSAPLSPAHHALLGGRCVPRPRLLGPRSIDGRPVERDGHRSQCGTPVRALRPRPTTECHAGPAAGPTGDRRA